MMNRRFALTAVAATLLSTTALAQMTMPQAGKVIVQGEETAQVGNAADFVRQAAGSGVFEIESSRLALDKTLREPVRVFARHMVDDHSRANQQLASLARTQGIEPPTQPDPAKQQKIAQLQTLSGSSFDRMYINEQVVAHRQAVDLFETASRNGAPDMQSYQGFIAQALPIRWPAARRLPSLRINRIQAQ
jgi:putative membrane protein